MKYLITFYYRHIQYRIIMDTRECRLDEIMLNLENQYKNDFFGDVNNRGEE